MAVPKIERLANALRQQNAVLQQQQAMISHMQAKIALLSIMAVQGIAKGALDDMTPDVRDGLASAVVTARDFASQAEGMGSLDGFIEIFANHLK